MENANNHNAAPTYNSTTRTNINQFPTLNELTKTQEKHKNHATYAAATVGALSIFGGLGYGGYLGYLASTGAIASPWSAAFVAISGFVIAAIAIAVAKGYHAYKDYQFNEKFAESSGINEATLSATKNQLEKNNRKEYNFALEDPVAFKRALATVISNFDALKEKDKVTNKSVCTHDNSKPITIDNDKLVKELQNLKKEPNRNNIKTTGIFAGGVILPIMEAMTR